jgi:hypothetical protein
MTFNVKALNRVTSNTAILSVRALNIIKLSTLTQLICTQHRKMLDILTFSILLLSIMPLSTMPLSKIQFNLMPRINTHSTMPDSTMPIAQCHLV